MSISENIKRLRESHGMTQAQFGDIAGVTDKAVSTWESGKKEPRMGAIQKLCDHFGISKSDILLDADDLSKMNVRIAPADDLTAPERELVHRYRRAPQNIKDAVDAVLAPYGEQAANPASSEQSAG